MNHGMDLEDDDDVEILEEEKSITIGIDYQAVVADDVLSKNDPQREEVVDTSICTWAPTHVLPDGVVREYVKLARKAGDGNYDKYTTEQVLGILFHCNYDTDLALSFLESFSPEVEGWTFEEKVVFEQVIELYNKDFRRIVREFFPQKPIQEIVKRYYQRKAWCKAHNKKEVIQKNNHVRQETTTKNADASNPFPVTTIWAKSEKPKQLPSTLQNQLRRMYIKSLQVISKEKEAEEIVQID